LTRSIKSRELWRILLNRIPLSQLQRTRINALQVQRQTVLYDDAVVWLEGILNSRATVEVAKKYLIQSGNFQNLLTNRYYLYFARAVWHYLNQNPLTAQTNIQALYSQFVSCGYSADILRTLAFLQGIHLQTGN